MRGRSWHDLKYRGKGSQVPGVRPCQPGRGGHATWASVHTPGGTVKGHRGHQGACLSPSQKWWLQVTVQGGSECRGRPPGSLPLRATWAPGADPPANIVSTSVCGGPNRQPPPLTCHGEPRHFCGGESARVAGVSWEGRGTASAQRGPRGKGLGDVSRGLQGVREHRSHCSGWVCSCGW